MSSTVWVHTLILFVICVFAFTMVDIYTMSSIDTSNKEHATAMVNTMHLISLVAWPLVWYTLVYGYIPPSTSAYPHIISLCWPMVLIVLEMCHFRRVAKVGFQFETLYRYSYFQATAGTLIAAAFAIGTLMGDKLNKQAQRSIVSSVLICVLTLLPTSSSPITSRTSLLVRHSQKVCLIYAIGLICSGMICTMSS
jgi:hypothetical protein